MTEPPPLSIAVYRRGPAWVDGTALGDQPTLLDHGRFLAELFHFVPDEADPAHIMATLLDALPSGGYFAASHGAPEFNPEGSAAWSRTYRASGVPFQLRTTDEFAQLPAEVGIIGAVARKP